MRDLCGEILDPPDELVRPSPHAARAGPGTAPVTFALDKLWPQPARHVRGTTTVTVDWDNGPGVVVDLSAVYQNTDACW